MANLTTVDGPQSLRVTTEADGTVVVDFVGDETAAGEASSLDTPADGPMQAVEDVSSGDTPAFSDDVAMDVADGLRAYTVAPDPGGQYHQECADDPNNDLGFEDNTNFIWYIRTSTIPTEQGISRAAAIADLRQGYDNWEQSRNICGWPDQIDARNRYGGGRDVPSRIGTRGECTGPDGVYMVDFGALPQNKLGVNCTYGTADGESNEADIKLNRWDRSWFTGEIPAGCSNLDSIENIMTHEAGHTYGLGDFYWQGAKYMTMHGYLFPCDRRAVTLGWGDYRLAREKY